MVTIGTSVALSTKVTMLTIKSVVVLVSKCLNIEDGTCGGFETASVLFKFLFSSIQGLDMNIYSLLVCHLLAAVAGNGKVAAACVPCSPSSVSREVRGCCCNWKAARCTVFFFLVVSGRRCADDIPRVGSLLPCVGYTSVKRVMSNDRWLPAEKSTARWASGAVPPAESVACCVTMCVRGASHVGWNQPTNQPKC